MTIFLSAIGTSSRLMKSFALDDLDIRPDQRRLLDLLKYDGFERCMVDPSNDVLAMAKMAIEDLLQGTAIKKEEVDAVLFCSDSVSNGEHALKGPGEISSREEVLKLLWG